jgi:hypothetical protein
MLTQYTIAQQALSIQLRRALTKACTRFGSVLRLAAGRAMQNRQQSRECAPHPHTIALIVDAPRVFCHQRGAAA